MIRLFVFPDFTPYPPKNAIYMLHTRRIYDAYTTHLRDSTPKNVPDSPMDIRRFSKLADIPGNSKANLTK